MTTEEEQARETLVHCIYTSAASVDFSREEVVHLLEISRHNNASRDITGMLLFDRGSFFQVLEGRLADVETLLARIQRDSRHDRVKRIIYEEIEERGFADWTMGYVELSMDDLAQIEGSNDFFKSNSTYRDLDEGRTKKLLEAFKKGKWRSSLR